MTTREGGILDNVYGVTWKNYVTELIVDKPIADFRTVGAPIAHFRQVAQIHIAAKQKVGWIPAAQYQPEFYEQCVELGGVTSEATSEEEFDEELSQLLDGAIQWNKLVWTVPEALRNQDDWPDDEEVIVAYQDIFHLLCPVWKNATQNGQTVISFGTEFNVVCTGQGSQLLPNEFIIPVSQLRRASDEEIRDIGQGDWPDEWDASSVGDFYGATSAAYSLEPEDDWDTLPSSPIGPLSPYSERSALDEDDEFD